MSVEIDGAKEVEFSFLETTMESTAQWTEEWRPEQNEEQSIIMKCTRAN
jgi:hypothetical protein